MALDLLSYLPPFEGLLPKWLLLVSLISLANSLQAYTTLHYAARVYNPNPDTSRPPSNITPSLNLSSIPPGGTIPAHKLAPGEIASQVTPLSGRKWGTWTALTGIVRFYVAYNINQKAMYELGVWTYGVAWAHYMAEWWVYGTCRWGAPLAGPVVISTGSLVWMVAQRGFYLGQ
ncbi:ergosterol biosynthesis protein-like protein [Bimuria novae-zelandiae CBS 107.79]|uniref:Ergosterol biosynthesis protein-like protein n=1 Tax=Bimuria novae-zelandiae CBS 107.79 TaxID=1447943 RepID=A0A6A5VSR2_9PLEO|nr:ergosterol biosynthesis protein-like protein [Bimuria novae-zelandiae CBS 107.79]